MSDSFDDTTTPTTTTVKNRPPGFLADLIKDALIPGAQDAAGNPLFQPNEQGISPASLPALLSFLEASQPVSFNPEGVIQRGQGDILDAFDQRTGAASALFGRSGVFGGSASQEDAARSLFSRDRALGDVRAGAEATLAGLEQNRIGQMTSSAAALFPQLTGATAFPTNILSQASNVAGSQFSNQTQHGQFIQPGLDPIMVALAAAGIGADFFKPSGVSSDVDDLLANNPGNIFGGGPVFGMPPPIFG